MLRESRCCFCSGAARRRAPDSAGWRDPRTRWLGRDSLCFRHPGFGAGALGTAPGGPRRRHREQSFMGTRRPQSLLSRSRFSPGRVSDARTLADLLMQAATLLRRNLTYYWRTNLAVIVGVAIAVSVLAGRGAGRRIGADKSARSVPEPARRDELRHRRLDLLPRSPRRRFSRRLSSHLDGGHGDSRSWPRVACRGVRRRRTILAFPQTRREPAHGP